MNNKTADRFSISHLPAGPGVYRITCIVTGEFYIGGTANVLTRVRQHGTQLAYRNHYSDLMLARYLEHGAAGFSAELIESCDFALVPVRERHWIDTLSPAFNTNRPVAKPKPEKATGPYLKRKAIAQSIVDGLSPEAAMMKFGVCAGTVNKSLREQGMSVSKILRLAREKRIVELHKEGMAGTEIAGVIGTTESCVSLALRKVGIKRKRGRKPGTPNPATAFVPREKWESMDWTKQNCEIAHELLVTNERVRQVRLMLAKAKSPRHRERAFESVA